MSSELSGNTTNLDSVIGGSGVASGIAGGDVLSAYAEAALGDDEAEIAVSRSAVQSELGDAAMVDAAAVIANFQRMVRIADGCGIPLDEPVMMMSQSIREDLGLNSFGGAENAVQLPFVKRLLGRALAPFTPRMLKRMAARRAP